MNKIARLAVSVLALVLLTSQISSAAAPLSSQPRYITALRYLDDARYYLEHTDEWRAGAVDYRPALSNIYTAIGALDNIVGSTVANREAATTPPPITNEAAALHHVYYDLVGADQLLGPGDPNPVVNTYRATALQHVRAAAGDVSYMIRACHC